MVIGNAQYVLCGQNAGSVVLNLTVEVLPAVSPTVTEVKN
jgi:hypothetical protein